MNTIPLFVYEEHHEAYIIFHYMVNNNMMSVKGDKTLLHVDYHSDMDLFPYSEKIPDISTSIDREKDFTMQQLCISSFLVPSIFQYHFNNVCWLVPDSITQEKEQIKLGENSCFYIRSHKEKKKTLIMGNDQFHGLTDKTWQDRFSFCYWTQTMNKNIVGSSPIILDIDLDFFASALKVDKCEKIEITYDEYKRCKQDNYRKLNLFYRYKLQEEEGRYFIEMNPKYDIESAYEIQEDLDDIVKQLDKLTRFISTFKERVACILICKSRISGYSSKKYCNFIEKKLINNLHSLFPLEYNENIVT